MINLFILNFLLFFLATATIRIIVCLSPSPWGGVGAGEQGSVPLFPTYVVVWGLDLGLNLPYYFTEKHSAIPNSDQAEP